MKLSNLVLFIVFVIGVCAVVFLFKSDFSGAAVVDKSRTAQIYGGLYDSEDRPMYTSRRSFSWQLSDGSLVDVLPNFYTSVVAFGPDSRIVGDGTIEEVRYSLNLYGNWQRDASIVVKLGYYDAKRPERNKLFYCTTLDTASILNNRAKRNSIFMDLTCDNITVVESAPRSMYR